MKHANTTPKERFMKNVIVRDGHWIWIGKTDGKYGYGLAYDAERHKYVAAHRLSYELFVKPIPNDKIVLHKHEKMKYCVNPECLYLGTHHDNAMDYKRFMEVCG